MKRVKNIVLILMVILLIATISMSFMGAWMPILSVLSGFVFIYYLVLYILIRIAEKRSNKTFNYIIYFFVFAPLLLIVFDAVDIIDNFLSYALRDFRYEI